jgi:hypothetical protein
MGSAAVSGAGANSGLAGAGGGALDIPATPCADGILSPDATRCYIVSNTGAAWQAARDEFVALEGGRS